jgi:hypothetical protein
MGSGHTVFANRAISVHVTNRGINVQTDTNQDQGCETGGGTSAITNTCTATSTPGSTQTTVTLRFATCTTTGGPISCNTPVAPNFCNNIGCQSITCSTFVFGAVFDNCVTDNGVQFTTCTFSAPVTCTRTEPGTGITQSGGVSGG